MKKRLALVSLTLLFGSLGSLRAQDRARNPRAFARRAESEKVRLASTPPMGWNRRDSYGTTIPEDEFKRNAQWLAQYLKAYGWQYVVVDMEWFVTESSGAGEFQELAIPPGRPWPLHAGREPVSIRGQRFRLQAAG